MRLPKGGTMTDEEWSERIAKEKKARADNDISFY